MGLTINDFGYIICHMFDTHAQNHEKVKQCFVQLQSMDMVAKSKMFKFYKNVSKKWEEMDKEFVNCRRSRRVTPKYTDLELELNDCIRTFEQYSIIATLMYAFDK